MLARVLKFIALCALVFSGYSFAENLESKSGPYSIRVETKVFVDLTRPSRPIDTDIYYPEVNDATLLSMPLVIYSHGVMSNNLEMKSLLSRIASFGYRVLAMNSARPNETSDLKEKIRDISFIYEKFKTKPSTTIFMGYSLGSLAAIKAGDIHVPALVVAIAPPTFEFQKQDIGVSKRYLTPLRAIIGQYDSVAPASISEPFFESLTGDIEYYNLEKATHLGFLDKGGAFPALADRIMCRRFKDHYPSTYKCPSVYFDAISNKEQKIITSDLILSILNNKFLGYD